LLRNWQDARSQTGSSSAGAKLPHLAGFRLKSPQDFFSFRGLFLLFFAPRTGRAERLSENDKVRNNTRANAVAATLPDSYLIGRRHYRMLREFSLSNSSLAIRPLDLLDTDRSADDQSVKLASF